LQCVVFACIIDQQFLSVCLSVSWACSWYKCIDWLIDWLIDKTYNYRSATVIITGREIQRNDWLVFSNNGIARDICRCCVMSGKYKHHFAVAVNPPSERTFFNVSPTITVKNSLYNISRNVEIIATDWHTHTHTHARTHARTHTHKHTRTHARTHTHITPRTHWKISKISSTFHSNFHSHNKTNSSEFQYAVFAAKRNEWEHLSPPKLPREKYWKVG